MAITSMVLGICTLPFTMCCCGLFMVGSIVGLTLGIVAMNQIKAGGFTEGSRGMALAGVILNSIALLLGLGGIFFWVLL